MNYDDLMSIIENNPYGEERWLSNYMRSNPDVKTFTLRSDLDIRIVLYGADDKAFEEKWAKQFADPSAYSIDYEVFFRASPVESFFLVGVDGMRAMLPLPDAGTMEVRRRRHAIARAIDQQGKLDEYMAKAGLTVAT